jgi:hypothetical protein
VRKIAQGVSAGLSIAARETARPWVAACIGVHWIDPSALFVPTYIIVPQLCIPHASTFRHSTGWEALLLTIKIPGHRCLLSGVVYGCTLHKRNEYSLILNKMGWFRHV